MVERRHKFTVFYDVLNCCSPGQQQQADILRRSNLNIQYWGQIRAELLNNSLLSFKISRGRPGFKRYLHSQRRSLPEQKFYSTTPKGFDFIRKYSELLTLSIDRNLQVAE